MAKELTREDIIKKQYSELYKLNQRLKNISECYYISYDGTVYMKSLVPFVEKLIHLKYPDEINLFHGAMILPNQFFEFAKRAKKTKMTIGETKDSFIFGQNDDPELTYTVNIVNVQPNIDDQYRKERIIPKMYKRFFELGSDDYTQYPDQDKFYSLTEYQVSDIVNSKLVELGYNESTLSLTKHLLLDIKKNDLISISRNCYRRIDDKNYKVFYMLKNETELYDAYTIFNSLQQLKLNKV